MMGIAEPELIHDPEPINRNWFPRGLALAALAGAVIGLGLLVAFCLAGQDSWSVLLPAAVLGLPIGGMAGALDGLLALSLVAVIGRRARSRVWPAAAVAGPAAAAIPLIITFHAGYPTTDGGIWIGLGLSAAALVAGAALTPLALRSGARS